MNYAKTTVKLKQSAFIRDRLSSRFLLNFSSKLIFTRPLLLPERSRHKRRVRHLKMRVLVVRYSVSSVITKML